MERGTRRMKITFPFTFPSRRVATKRTGRSRSRKFFRRLTEENEKKKKTKKERNTVVRQNGTGSSYRFVRLWNRGSLCPIASSHASFSLFLSSTRYLYLDTLISRYFSYGIRLTQPTLLQVKEGLDLLMRKVYCEIFRFLLQVFFTRLIF